MIMKIKTWVHDTMVRLALKVMRDHLDRVLEVQGVQQDERWLYHDPKALASVARGLAEIKAATVVDEPGREHWRRSPPAD